MKKNTLIISLALLLTTGITVITGCNSSEPGATNTRTYMPDMVYSRAIETYTLLDPAVFTSDTSTLGEKIFYNFSTVPGSIKRGELFPYTLPNDSTGYKMSAMIKNPLPPLTAPDSIEASRLFNINCAICHGADGKADGPLADKIGGVANFTQSQYITLPDGTMFHSINYGKNNMGSYASQLDARQRWRIIQYIRTLQPKPVADSTKH
jgi:cbb3-type cytochrome c oxidase subunit III